MLVTNIKIPFYFINCYLEPLFSFEFGTQANQTRTEGFGIPVTY